MNQRDIIVELLRTRNLGGGQQGIMEWNGVKKRGSEMPLSGDHLKQAFGDSQEAYSRHHVERAIVMLRGFDPLAYRAIRSVFDSDVGGYKDLEFYRERSPALVEAAERGIDWLVWLLPRERYKLSADPGEIPMTEDEEEELHKRNAGVYKMWCKGVEDGKLRGVLVAEIADTYGISDRRVYQIVEQESPLEAPGGAESDEEGTGKGKGPGRPRKATAANTGG